MSLGHTPLLCAVNPYLVVLQTLFSIEYELRHLSVKFIVVLHFIQVTE